MKIAVVTDSTCYLNDEEVANNNITVIPIPVIVDGQVYEEGVTVSNAQYYDMLAHSQSFPSTSQPAIGQLINVYEGLRDQGFDAIISIHLSSTISGMYNTVANVANQIDGVKIYPYDSQITMRLMGELVIDAARMANAGETPEDILAELDKVRKTIKEFFVVDDLQNLVRGGRLSNASAFIGSVLKIKPLLTFDDNTHEIVAFEKVRSMKKARKRVEELFAEVMATVPYTIKLTVYHANAPKVAEEWYTELKQTYPTLSIEIAEIGPVIGTHLGQGALALGWMQDTSVN
ncbi:DegV family protein [Periweissella fabalis]|uniref:DegV family protein n=1 Tax=Periweissella fabalis TaxID=1070421 RepID=A0A7X6N2P2_9LACO|nr:DegV family protein [Periweissella fabalis]MCM0599313.1 DegV family protein [Periweissella fabalis]NKZ23592.1 DegV family protein [Periweissella fabalis]